MRYKVTFILILFSFSLFSQTFEQIDSVVRGIKFDKSISLDKLTGKLIKPFNNDIGKTMAIYCWIADNIEYDYNNFKNNTVTSEQVESETVFNRRKAVCKGYSNLFKDMLDLCNIESEVISGYARNGIETIFLNESNHAWNSVKLNGKWYLFDVTWARDTLNKKVEDFYFQTDPKIFILTHYPLDYKWSLLKNTYSLDDFMKFPIYTNLFFDLKFTNAISQKGDFEAVNDTVIIDIRPRFECLLLTKLYDLEKGEWIKTQMGQFVQGNGFFKLYVPGKGRFILQLGALQQDDDSYTINDPIIYYIIENK